ncbi:hypothetical protein QUA81_12255 [Microcoleus sp. F6_B4]
MIVRSLPKSENIYKNDKTRFVMWVLSIASAVFEPTTPTNTVMVLFEDRSVDLKYVAGDDDSGTDLNAQINVRLDRGRRYVLRIRLY